MPFRANLDPDFAERLKKAMEEMVKKSEAYTSTSTPFGPYDKGTYDYNGNHVFFGFDVSFDGDRVIHTRVKPDGGFAYEFEYERDPNPYVRRSPMPNEEFKVRAPDGRYYTPVIVEAGYMVEQWMPDEKILDVCEVVDGRVVTTPEGKAYLTQHDYDLVKKNQTDPAKEWR